VTIRDEGHREAHVKTDRIDAGVLASLRAAGFLPEVWLPDADTERRRRLVIRLPFCRQPRDHRLRQVRRVLAQEGGEGFLEVAGRHPTQVENRQQRIESLRPPRPTSAGSTR